ncbi:hypothetical protein F4801DRAFT_552716 [Xylaria longipes]|nr:hypothetical protein F4801DRAFT_552716 [Xylaria longipes]
MASNISDRSAFMCLPYEMKSMIFAALSDHPSGIIALAKTCKHFYIIYHNEKSARVEYAKNLIKKTVGFYSPTVLRLAILLVRWGWCMGREPEYRDYIIYCPEYWEFSAWDFEVARCARFEWVIRWAYRGATKVKMRRWGVECGPISVRQLAVFLSRAFWKKFGDVLAPRLNFLDFFCRCGPGFSGHPSERIDPLGTFLKMMGRYGMSFKDLMRL